MTTFGRGGHGFALIFKLNGTDKGVTLLLLNTLSLIIRTSSQVVLVRSGALHPGQSTIRSYDQPPLTYFSTMVALVNGLLVPVSISVKSYGPQSI